MSKLSLSVLVVCITLSSIVSGISTKPKPSGGHHHTTAAAAHHAGLKGEEIMFGYRQSERQDSSVNRLCCPRRNLYDTLKRRFDGDDNVRQCETRSYMEKSEESGEWRLASTALNSCFGGTGDNCNGIPGEGALSMLRPDQFKLCRSGSGAEKDEKYCFTTVGSIRHDLCCFKYPDGAFCNDYNYNVLSMFSDDKACACASEWRKALLGVVRQGGWIAKFPSKVYTDPKALATQVGMEKSRPTILPETKTKWESGVDLRGISETTATIKLQAPGGSHLDCPNTDPACELSCDGRKDGCHTPNDNLKSISFRHGVVAGDSVFCESGKFSRIAQNGNYRFGICSGSDTDGQDANEQYMQGFCEAETQRVQKKCSAFKAGGLGKMLKQVANHFECTIAKLRLQKHCTPIEEGKPMYDEPKPSHVGGNWFQRKWHGIKSSVKSGISKARKWISGFSLFGSRDKEEEEEEKEQSTTDALKRVGKDAAKKAARKVVDKVVKTFDACPAMSESHFDEEAIKTPEDAKKMMQKAQYSILCAMGQEQL
jgi:hypothetical protein